MANEFSPWISHINLKCNKKITMQIGKNFFKINVVDQMFEDKFPQAAHEKPMIKSKFNAITPVLGDYHGESASRLQMNAFQYSCTIWGSVCNSRWQHFSE